MASRYTPRVRHGRRSRFCLPRAEHLNEQVGKVAALKTAQLRQKIIEAGFSVSGTARADTDRMLRAEAQRWAVIVKASGVKGD